VAAHDTPTGCLLARSARVQRCRGQRRFHRRTVAETTGNMATGRPERRVNVVTHSWPRATAVPDTAPGPLQWQETALLNRAAIHIRHATRRTRADDLGHPCTRPRTLTVTVPMRPESVSENGNGNQPAPAQRNFAHRQPNRALSRRPTTGSYPGPEGPGLRRPSTRSLRPWPAGAVVDLSVRVRPGAPPGRSRSPPVPGRPVTVADVAGD
jgi:hypothetical protein